MRDDGFDNDVICKATIIWEDANEMVASGLSEDGKFLWESAFLAHINIFENLLEIESYFNEYDDGDLMGALNTDIPPWKNFIFTWTGIGRDLQVYIENVETAIQTKLTPPRPTGARLSLVPSPPQ